MSVLMYCNGWQYHYSATPGNCPFLTFIPPPHLSLSSSLSSSLVSSLSSVDNTIVLPLSLILSHLLDNMTNHKLSQVITGSIISRVIFTISISSWWWWYRSASREHDHSESKYESLTCAGNELSKWFSYNWDNFYQIWRSWDNPHCEAWSLYLDQSWLNLPTQTAPERIVCWRVFSQSPATSFLNKILIFTNNKYGCFTWYEEVALVYLVVFAVSEHPVCEWCDKRTSCKNTKTCFHPIKASLLGKWSQNKLFYSWCWCVCRVLSCFSHSSTQTNNKQCYFAMEITIHTIKCKIGEGEEHWIMSE